ncbi:MAG: urea carboxylase-associated family protein [Sphingomonadales bacterium]|nr:MAG: urea carboxylase-associated family protein [Sphingomonadales bacterium]
MTTVIAPRSTVAFRLSRDQIQRVIDPEGGQVSDLLAFNAPDVRAAISNERTFDYEKTIQLTTGNPVAFNIFMNVPVGPDGQIKVLAPPTAPGDFIRLRALDDLIIGLMACSADDSCGGSFKPIHYQIER